MQLKQSRAIMENERNKYSSTLLIFYFLIWILYNVCVYGYNIETQKVAVLSGSPGSQFGYSVAFANEPGWVEKLREGKSFNKVLLVGAPNTTVRIDLNTTIKGYGDVQKCTAPQTNKINCTSLRIREVSNTTGKSLCDQLRKNPNKSHCEEDQRLGATIAVNRKFSETMSPNSTVPMVTVCAPGWKNTYNEFSENDQKYMIGVCLKLRENLQYMDCRSEDSKEYCWPFWPSGPSTFRNGKPVYTYAQSGLSMGFSRDGREEIIAAPGIESWRGGFKSPQGNFEKILQETDNCTTHYYGYSLATGNFKVRNPSGERCNIVAGVSNFYNRRNGTLGKIEVLRNGEKVEVALFGKKRNCSEMKSVDMTGQVGSKFGSSVAAIDITGDGYDEIFVGAPLYTGDQPDEGRVFVYITTDDELCGPIGILSGSALIKSSRAEAKYARFGSAITSAGDLNGDGFKDVAIGAPYEDSGRGALYIYHGIGRCNCVMEDKFVQRILGRDLDKNLRAFGWSIYGEDDIDHNLYPDLAVGAYASNHAVVLRTRPIADVDLHMVIRPNPIPLNGSSLSCSKDKIRLCAEMTVEFNVSGKGLEKYISLKLHLKADTVYSRKEDESRVLFRENGDSQLMRKFNITGNILQETLILDVKNRSNAVEPKDIWTKIRIEGTFQLSQTHVSEFGHLDPVLKKGKDSHDHADVAFEINCDNLEDCTSDLRLTVQLYLHSSGRIEEVSRDTIIYVDASNEMQMKVDVTNLVSSSYGSNFTSSVGAALIRDVTLSDSRQGAIDATCKQSSEFASSILNCSADNKLDTNQNFKILAAFDISRSRLMPEDRVEHLQPYIQVNVTAGQVTNDVNKRDNNFTIKLDVKLKYKVEISVDKETSDQIRYSADEESAKILSIIHRYYITNEGPSIVPKTYVNITVPLSVHNVVYAELKNVSEGCATERSEGLVDITTTPKSTETPSTRFTIQTPKPQRRRRELDQQESSIENTTHISSEGINTEGTSKSVLNITCQEGRVECVRITCEVKNLEKHDQKIINISIDIHEKSLAKTKNKREIRYGTSAVVTDPYVWFGDKVVSWDKTPFGEKYTTFLVKPETVVTEINVWIIIGSVLGAIVLLIIVVAVLWKVGFFKRKKHSKVKKWKEDYKRTSRASLTKSQQPDNPMEK